MAACSSPSLTSNPLNTPDEGPTVVSVCYSPGMADMETQTVALAAEACAEAGAPVARPRQWKRTFFINDCPLFKAMRVAYICQPDPDAAPADSGEEAAPASENGPLTGNQDS